jgi:ABC-type transport system involved in Fe-S cluster assembly fused permease/ATPase subunit
VLDSKTDATIQSSLQNELSETTQHIVVHRLQTIMDANKIVSPLHGCHLAYVSTSDCLEHVDGA